MLHPSLTAIPMPARIAGLPRDHRQYPVPFFVAWIDGQADHRVIERGVLARAVNEHRCWICGAPLGKYLACLLGPMCTVSRTVAEPPSHRDCAEYAVQACPFMARPHARRREAGIPEGAQDAAGIPIDRNPGVICLWITRRCTPFRAQGGNEGVLFRVGDPTAVAWYAAGRPATRAEVLASLESGLPLLRAQCEQQGPEAHAALTAAVQRAHYYLPAA